ncbi:MAG: hypothetical protein EXS64_00365 [Candidatus Latescibacteria bacterium]|nr:hypothetical protein [Candidatus Latescibacterota bacterium]
MNLAAWEQDFGLLFGGLWKGVIDLVRWAGTFSVADALSWALLLLIAFLVFSDWIGRERCLRWGGVLLYTTFVYLTLPLMPGIWKTLYIHTNGRINLIGDTVAAAVGLGLLLHLCLRRRERRWQVYAMLVPLGAVYTAILTHIQTSPAERLHLAEYGFLSYLTFRALRVDMGYRSAYLWGWILASGLGALDEGIQGWLPNRVGEWADVRLNVLACGLGMVAVMLVASRK